MLPFFSGSVELSFNNFSREHNVFDVFMENIILAYFLWRMNGKNVLVFTNKCAEFLQLSFVRLQGRLRRTDTPLKRRSFHGNGGYSELVITFADEEWE